MNFVELRILHLIELSRNFAVRSLKRNLEMQIYSEFQTANRVLHYQIRSVLPKIYFQKDYSNSLGAILSSYQLLFSNYLLHYFVLYYLEEHYAKTRLMFSDFESISISINE